MSSAAMQSAGQEAEDLSRELAAIDLTHREGLMEVGLLQSKGDIAH